ncbi:MAG: hypothetical protein CMK44_05320 [Porticoccus sp.]|jgi:hypothetical protein|nr:hypothetical protein [Porticoccus sp.]
MTEDTALKILVISIQDRNPNNDKLYDHLGKKCKLELLKLSKLQAKIFYNYINPKDSDSYDRILIDLPFRLIYPHAKKLRKQKKLVFYEEDSCQNYIKNSSWFGKFIKFYASIPNSRALTTSKFVTEGFKKSGIDAVYIGKSYDESVIINKKISRKIKFAFVGRVKSKVYSERKAVLDEILNLLPLKILRSEPGVEYNLLLNEITYFISVDFGLGEYMIKNFEALAAGCVLCTYRLPYEFLHIGFKDMENAVLYSTPEELVQKIKFIEKNSALKASIIENGLLLAQSFTFESHAKKLYKALSDNILVDEKSKPRFLKFF